jgi:hypothetical protein
MRFRDAHGLVVSLFAFLFCILVSVATCWSTIAAFDKGEEERVVDRSMQDFCIKINEKHLGTEEIFSCCDLLLTLANAPDWNECLDGYNPLLPKSHHYCTGHIASLPILFEVMSAPNSFGHR